jgi:hypothetical protein
VPVATLLSMRTAACFLMCSAANRPNLHACLLHATCAQLVGADRPWFRIRRCRNVFVSVSWHHQTCS